MQRLSYHNQVFSQPLPTSTPSLSQPLSKPWHNTQAPPETSISRANGDRELAMRYRTALLVAAQSSTMPTINYVPPHSTFGQWWGQLRDAFQSTDVRQWIKDNRINPATITLDPQKAKSPSWSRANCTR